MQHRVTYRSADRALLFEPHRPLHVRYAQGELITQIGSYAAGIYVVQQGLVQEQSPAAEPETGEGTAEILGIGDFVGLEILLPDAPDLHVTASRALTDVRLSFLERSAFHDALDREPELRAHVQSYLARRVFELREAVSRSRSPLPDQLRSLLLHLSERWTGAPSGPAVELPEAIDRRLLADLLGVSTARITRALRALAIESGDGGIRVDPAALGGRSADEGVESD